MPIQEPVGGCTIEEQREFRNYTLIASKQTVVCYVPPACTLDITGTTVTNVTIQGGSDGEIAAATSGATGATLTWFINNAEDTTGTALTHDFTGLTAGFYDIRVEEEACTALEYSVQVLDGEFRTGNMVLTQAKDLTASENPIIYELRTAQSSGIGNKAVFNLDIDATITNGDSITFNLTAPYEYSQTFYAKGFPDKSNYFLASVLTDQEGNTVGANTLSEIAQSLADALQNDVLIPKVYTINYNGGQVVSLKAKEDGERFTLSNNNVIISGNIDSDVVQVGVNSYDGQQVDNYSIYAEVFENDLTLQYPDEGVTSDYVRVAELELPFSQSNIHRFDLAPIMRNFVTSARPRFESTGSTVQPDMMKPYYIRYGEKYPLVSNTNTKKKRFKGVTDVKWVINSALNHYAQNDMSAYLGSTLHDVKASFTAYLTFPPAPAFGYDYDLTFNNYLYQTGNTTGIAFRVNDTYNAHDYGYQTGTTFELTGNTSYPYVSTGKLYISGTTAGADFVYERNYQAFGSWKYIHVYGTPDFEQLGSVLFLTNAPDPKLIQRASQEYLYFILKAGYDQQLDVRGDLDFYDGSSVSGATFFEIQNATGNSAGGVMALNLSYDKLGLAAYETSGSTTRKIKRATFAIWQNSGDTRYSDHKAYRFEIEDRPRKFGIVFNNVVGGFDSFDFVGIVEETINRSKGTYTIPIPYNTDGSAGQGFKSSAQFNTKVTNKIIVNSGWIDETHFDWLKELMESNDIYSYTTTNQNYLNLDAFKYIKSSLDDLFEVECTFTQTIYENSIDV